MHFNNVCYILVVQTEKKKYNDPVRREGGCSILLCISNELMKTDTFTPTQLCCTRQVTNAVPRDLPSNQDLFG